MTLSFLRTRKPTLANPAWWAARPSFTLAGRSFPLFIHGHNCGWPPARMTERAVELALTDHWLHLVRAPERVVEVGAVTPYYWPRRVSQVVDPCDLHPLVTHRVSVFDVDLTERPVISISTFEHIGAGDYKLAADPPLVSKAFRKLFRESPNFLITVPVGFNEFLDDLLFGTAMPRDGVEIHFIIRSPTANDWKESDPAGARLPYPRDAKGQDRWANSLAIVSRGQFC